MENKVQMAPREVLLSIAFIEASAEGVRGLNLSRRRTPDWLAEVLYRWITEDGVILDWDGNPVDLYDELIDDVHGNDASCTWPSKLKAITPGSRVRNSRASMASRLGLYQIAFELIGRPLLPLAGD